METNVSAMAEKPRENTPETFAVTADSTVTPPLTLRDAITAAAAADTPAPIEIVERRHGRIPAPRRRSQRPSPLGADWLAQLTDLADPDQVSAVDELTINQALKALAPATLAARAADLADYADFLARHNRPPAGLPASRSAVVDWIEDLVARGQRPTTIDRKLSSLSVSHEMLGLESPTESLAVRHAVKSARRTIGTTRRQSTAIRLDDAEDAGPLTLRGLLAACDSPDLRDLRDAALVSIAYDGGLRASEVIGIQVEHLRLHADGTGTLLIPRSKTDQTGEGAFVAVSAETMGYVEAWLKASEITGGSLFRRIAKERRLNRAGKPARPDIKSLGGGRIEVFVSPAQAAVYTTTRTIAAESAARPGSAALTRPGLTKIYRHLAQRAANLGHVEIAGLELATVIARFSTHGFRVGMAQDLVAARYDIGQIQLALRWKSATTALGYVRELSARDNAAADYLRERRGRRGQGR
jgi:site-specific recombinase XerD